MYKLEKPVFGPGIPLLSVFGVDELPHTTLVSVSAPEVSEGCQPVLESRANRQVGRGWRDFRTQ